MIPAIKMQTNISHPFITAGNIVNSFAGALASDSSFQTCWDGSAATDRITVGSNGHYLFGGQIQQQQVGSDQTATFALLVNGTQVASGNYGTDLIWEADLVSGDFIQLKVLSGSQNYFGLWMAKLGSSLSSIQALSANYELFNDTASAPIAEAAVSATPITPSHSGGSVFVTSSNDAMMLPTDGSVYLLEAEMTINESQGAILECGVGATLISAPGPRSQGPAAEVTGSFGAGPGISLLIRTLIPTVEGDSSTLIDAFSFLASWGTNPLGHFAAASVLNMRLTKLVGEPCPDVISNPSNLTFHAPQPTQIPVLIDDTTGVVSHGVCSGCALVAGNYHVKFALWDGATGYTNIVDWTFTANGTDWYEKDWDDPVGHPSDGRAWVSFNGGPFQHITDASGEAYRTGVYLDSTVPLDSVAVPSSVENITTLGGTNPSDQTIALTSTPDTSYSVSIDQPWLSAVQSGGSTPGTITVSIDVTQTIGAGPFTGTVTITPLCCPPVEITVSLVFNQPRGLGCDLPRNKNAFLLIEKTPQSNQTYQMKAVNYDDAYYDHDGEFDLTGTGGFVTGGEGDGGSIGFGTSFGIFGG